MQIYFLLLYKTLIFHALGILQFFWFYKRFQQKMRMREFFHGRLFSCFFCSISFNKKPKTRTKDTFKLIDTREQDFMALAYLLLLCFQDVEKKLVKPSIFSKLSNCLAVTSQCMARHTINLWQGEDVCQSKALLQKRKRKMLVTSENTKRTGNWQLTDTYWKLKNQQKTLSNGSNEKKTFHEFISLFVCFSCIFVCITLFSKTKACISF